MSVKTLFPGDPPVVIISSRQKFVSAASEELANQGIVVRTLSTAEATDPAYLAQLAPEIAFVDLVEDSTEGIPLRRLIPGICPGCQVVLVCALGETNAAARFVRSGEVFGYVLEETTYDPERIPLLVELARKNRVLPLTSSDGSVTPAYEKAIQTLSGLRNTLKKYRTSEVVKLLDSYGLPSNGQRRTASPAKGLSSNGRSHLVDLIFGRLRLAEQYILLAISEDSSDAGGPDFGKQHESKTQPQSAKRTQGVGECQIDGRILVVDDDEICTELAREILENAGFTVDVAQTPHAALENLAAHLPDLILMDVHLDRLNGLQLVRTLRQRDAFRNIPVLMVTSDRTRETLADAIDANVAGYILKPYDSNFVTTKIRAVLQDLRSQCSAETNDASTSSVGSPSSWEMSTARVAKSHSGSAIGSTLLRGSSLNCPRTYSAM